MSDEAPGLEFDESTMREMAAPKPKTIDELVAVIEGMGDENDHDYGTCVYAVSVVATAAFNYMASRLGITGAQAQFADMDIIRRTRLMEGPFMLVDGDNHRYPQYDLRARLDEWITEKVEPWAAEKAAEDLAKLDEFRQTEEGKKMVAEGLSVGAHPNVIAHWKHLVDKVKERTK